MIEWQQLGGHFGAICPTQTDVMAIPAEEVKQALASHQLLVFPGQRLSTDDFERFAAGLGEPAEYPYAAPLAGSRYLVPIIKEAADQHNFGGAWHTDTSYLEHPPAVTLLLAREVPASGGDTLFADMYQAFERLSPGLRHCLSQLDGINTSALVHAAVGDYASVAGDAGAAGAATQATARHPAVRRHPVTGRAALYVSLVHTERFSGMTRAESLPLLNYLQAQATRADNCVRVHWAPGTLAIWDNRCLQHLPLNDYPGQRREMHRIILAGEKPLGSRPS